jgi:hypothetical protein
MGVILRFCKLILNAQLYSFPKRITEKNIPSFNIRMNVISQLYVRSLIMTPIVSLAQN